MARWKLTEAHYLKVEGTFWEYSQIDRRTGKPKRTQYPVPLFLDPRSLDDLMLYGQMDPAIPSNDPEEWIIVVTDTKGVNAKDIFYEGDPTPGMLPLDDSAKAISARYAEIWSPTKGTDDDSQRNSYANKIISGLLDKVNDMKASTEAIGTGEFMQTMKAMMKQQTDILAMLAQNQSTRNNATLLRK